MNALIPLLLSLLQTAAPSLGGPAVQQAILITTQLVPILIEAGGALLPRLKNIITALKGNDAITPELLAELDAAEALIDAEFEAAATAAEAEDAAG
jgi:hypothetical protein